MLRLYGIPTCDSCRKARTYLKARGLPFELVDLRQHPPEPAQIAAWSAALGSRALRNTSGASYRSLGPRKDTMSEGDWLVAFAADPMLIKRPVLERDGAALCVGFAAEVFERVLATE